jgi:hypothetical protein
MRNPCSLTRRPARRAGLLLGGALSALLGAGHPAEALVITPTFASNITSDPNAAAIEGVINTAISTYEADFNDPITVAITFQEGGGLGGSSTFFANVSYSAYLAALKADATTSNDAIANSLLPNSASNPVNGASTTGIAGEQQLF